MLLSARNTWREDDCPALISQASTAFHDAWTMFAAPDFSDFTPPSHPFDEKGLVS